VEQRTGSQRVPGVAGGQQPCRFARAAPGPRQRIRLREGGRNILDTGDVLRKSEGTEGPATPQRFRGGVSPVRDSSLRVARRREGGGGRQCSCPPCRRLRRHHHQCLQLAGHRAAQLHAEALSQGTDRCGAGAGKEGGGASCEDRLHHVSPSPMEASPGVKHNRGEVHAHPPARRFPGSSAPPCP